MRRKLDNEVKAGIFLFLGLMVILTTILFMGGGKSLFEKSFVIYVVVPDAGGVGKGAYIRSGGLKIGRVDSITFNDTYQEIKIGMLINESFHGRIKEDSAVKFQTQGVLGDKYLEITAGTIESPVIKPEGTIAVESSKDLSSMFADGSSAIQLLKENLANLKVITGSLAQKNQMNNIMHDLAETSSNMKEVSKQLKTGSAIQDLNSTVKNLKIVSDKMKNGEGTIGALFNDSSLYEDLKHLIGGANRNNVLKFFVRQAVKSSDNAEIEKEEKAAKGKEPASSKK